MLISLFVIFLLSASGLSLTYLFAKDESFMWRLCAGNVAGSVLFGLVCFLAACLFGLSAPTVLISILISLLPLALLLKPKNRTDLLANWEKAKSNYKARTSKRFCRLLITLRF